MSDRRIGRFALCALVVGAGLGGARGHALEVQTGLVNLSVALTDLCPDATDFLASYPVIEPELAGLPVLLTSTGDPETLARASYVPTAGLAGSVATAEVLPVVPDEGADFRVEIERLWLNDGSWHRLGSPFLDSPATTICGPVRPRAVEPAGRDCEISECMALLDLRITLTGQASDLDALNPAGPIGCRATAFIDEQGSGSYLEQAMSGYGSFTAEELRGAGGHLEMLVRADGSNVRVAVGCGARIAPGQTGFQHRGDQMTPLSRATVLAPQCGCQPGEGGSIPVEMPLLVERNAGVLEGLFDIVGHTETQDRVFFRRVGDDWPWTVEDVGVPAGVTVDPQAPWRFEGAPATDVPPGLDVAAWALLGSGSQSLELPHRRWLNDGVAVEIEQTTDLGSTFLALPHSLKGSVVLTDLGAGLGLDGLVTEPSLSWGWDDDSESTSFLGARGRVVPPAIPGVSGDGARSRAVLTGSYEEGQGEYRLTSELLLAGLSPAEEGALDGSDTLPSPWLVDEVSLMFREGDVRPYRTLTTRIGPLLLRDTTPIPAGGTPEPLAALPELHMCLGRIGVKMRSGHSDIELSGPQAQVFSAGLTLTIPGDPFSMFNVDYAFASGTQERSNEVSVDLLLPAGQQYAISPSVTVNSVDGQSSWVRLSSRWYPPEGYLECGNGCDAVCLVPDFEGVEAELELSVVPTIPACLESGDLDFEARFDSTSPVTQLTLQVDEGAPEVLCGPCEVVDGVGTPVVVSRAISPAETPHTLRLEAVAESGCTASFCAQVVVPSQPLALSCAPDFSCVTTPDGAALGLDDSCIADHLYPPQVVGGCQYPQQITPLVADLGPFPVGETSIEFEALPGGVVCTTQVEVLAGEPYQLAYSAGEVLVVRDLGSGLDLMVENVGARINWLEFDSSGERIALAVERTPGPVLVFRIDTGVLEYAIEEHLLGRNVEFHPLDGRRLATVFASPGPPFGKSVGHFRDGQRVGMVQLPPRHAASEPEIAWSRDGSELLAIATYPKDPDDQPMADYWVELYHWQDASGDLQNVVTPRQEREAPREEPFELLFDSPPVSAFGSRRGVSQTSQAGLAFGSRIENEHLDLTADGGLAAFVRSGTAGVTLGVVTNPLAVGPPAIDTGPTYGGAVGVESRVAMSDDGNRVAVFLGDRIVVLEYPGYRPITAFPATDVRSMRFRRVDGLAGGQP